MNSNDYETSLIQFETLGFMWSLSLVCCLSISFVCVLIVFHWINSKWTAHPISIELSKLTMGSEGWRSVMSSINIEFRRFDKFTTGTSRLGEHESSQICTLIKSFKFFVLFYFFDYQKI